MQYSLFNEIIQMPTYETVYYGADGSQKELSIESTVLYTKGGYASPDQITVIGGKTGTTSAAGHCLILYTRDSTGSPYIAVIMNADSAEQLYEQMHKLLAYIDHEPMDIGDTATDTSEDEEDTNESIDSDTTESDGESNESEGSEDI